MFNCYVYNGHRLLYFPGVRCGWACNGTKVTNNMRLSHPGARDGALNSTLTSFVKGVVANVTAARDNLTA